MNKKLICIPLLVITSFAFGQLPAVSQGLKHEKLKVFIDCSGTFCDLNYLRSEIKLVDFLRDRLAANVHVLITSQRSGSGGRNYQLIFYGQNSFSNYIDTLQYANEPTATDDEKRHNLSRYVMLGLSPLIAKTVYGQDIRISMRVARDSGQILFPTKDKWNYWFFRINLDGNLSYDKVYKSSTLNTRFSVDRVTDNLKLEFDIYRSRERSVYQYEDTGVTTTTEVKNSNYGFYNSIVKAMSPHWSYGYQARISNSTFSNYKSKLYFNPALEYNFFNYKDVNNKFFVIRYGLDIINNHYYDTTIYQKMKETLAGQSFSAAVTLNQKWGTFNSGLSYHNYFQDFSLNHITLRLNLEARITGALSVSMYNSGSIVHDQVNLAGGDVSAEDVLSRRRQLGSTFNFNSYFGLSYRFGSKYNNVVNPRFEGYGGF